MVWVYTMRALDQQNFTHNLQWYQFEMSCKVARVDQLSREIQINACSQFIQSSKSRLSVINQQRLVFHKSHDCPRWFISNRNPRRLLTFYRSMSILPRVLNTRYTLHGFDGITFPNQTWLWFFIQFISSLYRSLQFWSCVIARIYLLKYSEDWMWRTLRFGDFLTQIITDPGLLHENRHSIQWWGERMCLIGGLEEVYVGRSEVLVKVACEIALSILTRPE